MNTISPGELSKYFSYFTWWKMMVTPTYPQKNAQNSKNYNII